MIADDRVWTESELWEEIERLRSENEANKKGLMEYEQKVIELMAEIHKLRANGTSVSDLQTTDI